MKDRNLEEQLAEKLGSRSIAPSQEAWERIARNRQQGKDSREKKKKKIFLYYAAAAAACLLFGSFAYFMMGADNDSITGPTMVNSDKEDVLKEAETPLTAPVNELPLKGDRKEPLFYEHINPVIDIASVNQQQSTLVTDEKHLAIKENQQEIVAAVMPVTKALTKDELYKAEVDYLLKNAIKEVAADKHLSNPTDNTALLKEVETEMDEYYREKAMSIFSLKHKTIRVVVKDQ